MGYYTDFTLTVEGSGAIYGRLMEEKDRVTVSDDYELSLGKFLQYGQQEIKWYDYDKDMKSLSTRWPNILFILDGIGEDGKVWRAWYRNGRSAQVEPTFIPPDLDKLLPIDYAIEEKALRERKEQIKARMAELAKELDSLGGPRDTLSKD